MLYRVKYLLERASENWGALAGERVRVEGR